MKEHFTNVNKDDMLESIAKKILLPVGECKMWLDHLSCIVQNRKRGAKKAAATRKSKKNAVTPTSTDDNCMDITVSNDLECTYCGTCWRRITAGGMDWM